VATGTIRYWASARQAAGCSQEPCEAATLAEALQDAAATHGPALAQILAHSSFLISAEPVGHRDHSVIALVNGFDIEVLPPFAGG
jgi:molybdopterin synthase sulfur carrier subunit